MLIQDTHTPGNRNHTRDIVCSYVANNAVSPTDLPGLISSVYAAVNGLGYTAAAAAPAPPQPAVSVKSSIKPDYLTCLHCGLRFKSLRRHLTTHHQQTMDQYRATFGLPESYPAVAPQYSEKRSELAKASGLGRKMPAKAKR